jgi:hypothetical protein|tara:strand:+ start:21453 stop:21584 length:132 start_codon:yes stop_codon:yes gene_type:complete
MDKNDYAYNEDDIEDFNEFEDYWFNNSEESDDDDDDELKELDF